MAEKMTQVRLWHKTTKDRAENILEEGFRLRRGEGVALGHNDAAGISFGGTNPRNYENYTLSDAFVAFDLGEPEADIVTLIATVDVSNPAVLVSKDWQRDGWYDRLAYGKTGDEITDALREMGYDAVVYPWGEWVIFDPTQVGEMHISRIPIHAELQRRWPDVQVKARVTKRKPGWYGESERHSVAGKKGHLTKLKREKKRKRRPPYKWRKEYEQRTL